MVCGSAGAVALCASCGGLWWCVPWRVICAAVVGCGGIGCPVVVGRSAVGDLCGAVAGVCVSARVRGSAGVSACRASQGVTLCGSESAALICDPVRVCDSVRGCPAPVRVCAGLLCGWCGVTV